MQTNRLNIEYRDTKSTKLHLRMKNTIWRKNAEKNAIKPKCRLVFMSLKLHLKIQNQQKATRFTKN